MVTKMFFFVSWVGETNLEPIILFDQILNKNPMRRRLIYLLITVTHYTKEMVDRSEKVSTESKHVPLGVLTVY
jgi:hypothetical protein